MFFWIPFCGINVKPQDVAPHGGIPYLPCEGTKFGPPRSTPNVAKGVRRNFRRRSRWSFWDQVINILDIFPPKLRAILPLKIGRLGPKKESILSLPTIHFSGAFAVSFREGISFLGSQRQFQLTDDRLRVFVCG